MNSVSISTTLNPTISPIKMGNTILKRDKMKIDKTELLELTVKIVKTDRKGKIVKKELIIEVIQGNVTPVVIQIVRITKIRFKQAIPSRI